MSRMPSKYKNVRIERDKIKFDSQRECSRYIDLKMMLRAGRISALKVHPWFDLIVNGVNVGAYEGDFSYVTKTGAKVVEDVKGVRTAVYRLKKRLMLAIHGIDVVEVK